MIWVEGNSLVTSSSINRQVCYYFTGLEADSDVLPPILFGLQSKVFCSTWTLVKGMLMNCNAYAPSHSGEEKKGRGEQISSFQC